MVPQEGDTTATDQTDPQAEDWDAESVLAEHGLLPAKDGVPAGTDVIGETVGGLSDPDLADLTIVPDTEIDDGISDIVHSSEVGDEVDEALKKADKANRRAEADNAPDAELVDPTDADLAQIESSDTKGK